MIAHPFGTLYRRCSSRKAMFIGAELADPMTAAATWGMLHGVAVR